MGLFDRFIKPKWQHENSNVREKAVKTIRDQKILREIAKNDPDMFVRLAAVVNLEPLPQNQKTLEYIVRNEPTFDKVQVQAIRRITDKKILQRLRHSTTRNYIYSLTLEVEGIYKRPRNISEVKEKSNDKDYLLYVANCLGIDTDIENQAHIELFNMGYHHIEEDVNYTPSSRVHDRVMIDEGQKRIYLASPSNNSNF